MSSDELSCGVGVGGWYTVGLRPKLTWLHLLRAAPLGGINANSRSKTRHARLLRGYGRWLIMLIPIAGLPRHTIIRISSTPPPTNVNDAITHNK